MPVLMYGSENWVTDSLLEKIVCFLGELAKRALRWPRHHSNTAALVALQLESAQSRLLVKKLGFLKKLLMSNGVGVGAVAVKAMVDDVESWCLVKECRELDECTGLNFTDMILTQPEMVGLKEVKSTVRRVCWEKVLKKCEGRVPLIARLERMVGWGKLWDMVMDLGEKHI